MSESHKVSEAVSNGAERVRQRIEAMRAKAHGLGEMASERYEDVSAKAQEGWTTLEDKVASMDWKELEENFGETIRRKPVQSVLVAAGVGLLLGMLAGRRK